jgi:hypothetical protein
VGVPFVHSSSFEYDKKPKAKKLGNVIKIDHLVDKFSQNTKADGISSRQDEFQKMGII